MKNSYIKVQVVGRNINNYLKWLIKQKIEANSINVINHNKLELTIHSYDYNKLYKYSRTYKIKIIERKGILNIITNVQKNSFIIVSIMLAISLLYFVSNIIFKIEIIHNDKELIEKIKTELKNYDIEKYKLKKNYNYLNQVKEKILNNNKDTLEWLEIIEDGTKYIVKLVERKKEQKNNEYEYQSIATSKDAIITSIKASSGEKIKEINDYVKKNEIIVSGILKKPDGTLIYQKAKAKIIGEVWYKIDIEYPLAYYEEKLTGKSKNVLVINFLNYRIPLFSYSKYKEFKVKSNNIIGSQLLPISLSKEKQYEVEVKEEIYTWDEAISNAIEVSKKKLLENNNKILEIKKIEILNRQSIDSKIKLSLFISVMEDITKVIEIKKVEDKQNENNLQT